MHELLNRYVDEQTPEEAPPFEYVERAARGRKTRNRLATTLAAAVVVAGGAAVAVVDGPRADQAPAGPEQTVITIDPKTGNALDDGPPPDQFRYGRTVMQLTGEVRITSAKVDPEQATVLLVEAPRDLASSYNCLPDTVVRILSQDAETVRIAAYRYQLGSESDPDQPCAPGWQSGGPNVTIQLDLRQLVADRTVYAGVAGQRVILN